MQHGASIKQRLDLEITANEAMREERVQRQEVLRIYTMGLINVSTSEEDKMRKKSYKECG